MRLIDADAFLEYLIFSKHIDSLKCREVKEAVEMSKVDVLDKIRAEIDEQIKYNTYFNSDMAKGEIIAFEWVKRKMDEYGKEQE